MDDHLFERDEVFILVARILGEAADVACFHLNENSSCKTDGHIAGTRLRIQDDGKYFITV